MYMACARFDSDSWGNEVVKMDKRAQLAEGISCKRYCKAL